MGAFKRACGGHHTSIHQSKVESLGVYEAVWELPSFLSEKVQLASICSL